MKSHSYINDSLVDITDTLDIALWELDTNYRVLNCNQKAYEIYGKGVVGDFCYHAATGRDSICPNCPAQLVFAGHKNGRSEHTRITSGGETIVIDHTATPLRNQDGMLVGVVVTIVDITHLKNIEQKLLQHQSKLEDLVQKRTQELQESEKKYRVLANESPDLRYRTDNEGKLIFVSQSFHKLTGYTTEEAIGMKMTEFYVNPEERDLFLVALQKDGFVSDFVVQLKRKDGSIGWASVNTQLYKGQDGNILGVDGVVRDVTEQKTAQNLLLQSEQRLQLALEGADLGMWDWNLQTNELYFSPRYLSMLGYVQTEFPHTLKTWENLLHPDDKESAKQQILTSIKKGSGKWGIEFRLNPCLPRNAPIHP